MDARSARERPSGTISPHRNCVMLAARQPAAPAIKKGNLIFEKSADGWAAVDIVDQFVQAVDGYSDPKLHPGGPSLPPTG